MSNGAYAEIAKLINEGKLSDEARSRLSIELQMDIHQAVTTIAEQVETNSDRITELEQYPSIGYYFRTMPVKTGSVIALSWMAMELISESLPGLIALLLKIP